MKQKHKFIIEKEKFYFARHNAWLSLLPAITLYFYNGKIDAINFDFLLWDMRIDL